MVKFTSIYTLCFAVYCIWIHSFNPGQRIDTVEPIYKKIDSFYSKKLFQLKGSIIQFKKLCQQHKPLTVLRDQFKSARKIYKSAAILIEHFNLYEAAFLNAPAIDRAEEDNPDKIIPATGFQLIEQILFTTKGNPPYKDLDNEADKLIEIITRLENETDRNYKFTNEAVWDALTASVIRLTTLGITGFDSPVAFESIPEAGATLQGLKQLLDIYKPHLEKTKSREIRHLYALIKKTIDFLNISSSFNQFDRLGFIKRFMNPLYEDLNQIRNSYGSNDPGIYPINKTAKNIFSADAFNLRFFSPEKEYTVTPERIELGRLLFYDPGLSGNGQRSCATCHKPELAFTDGLPKALAIDNKTILPRNTPGLWNSCFQTRLFWDSRSDILENQLEEVVHNVSEMEGSFVKTMEELKRSSSYSDLFRKAYAGQKQPISGFNIANAIASYVRSLTALNSRFDLYMRGDDPKLTSAEKNGFNLFMGKAKCGSCHFAPLFNGLLPPQFSKTESEVLGVPLTTDTLHAELDPDQGKYLFTRSAVDKFSFKTPTLRNIELTGPYMHNGVYKTLQEVVEFYNKGGGKGLHIAPANQTLPFDKLNLTKTEIAHITSFMKSLTDTVYQKNHR